ncbi:AbfB domain-containing protein [Kibdelosporangium phytohabitans]|uniref:Alpha-L-arabinofuranosidase B arabinose-binding domain-containing protein n=1 Tax=Kibdelosporangium phytohabitans TaxID=860235 RepID=A0A0N9I244_9PSEU|nr:AbfB domain-containing protein [Kibdelosporangium phytohabitans]ALG08507.1 hypothetical protein AOZ06_17715 [Kibdelosporangium phytohabitans]MBE1470425.1 hypothetical protein [Kibdelosporangium phytohabitans]
MRIVKRGLVAVLATATVLGVPAPATASPAAPAAVTETPQSTQEDKARALARLGVLPEEPMLRLPDKDFVILLWRRATGAEVRGSAELAFSGSVAECTHFVKYGLHEAHARDQRNELRDEAIARAARQLRAKAATVIGITAEPELLIRGNRDFIHALYGRATGKRVKEAAFVAFGRPDEEQRKFLETGIFTAHASDQQEAIDADKELTEAQRVKLADRNAIGRAFAVVGVVATDTMRDLAHDHVIREIVKHAKKDTDVLVSASAALLSPASADWKAFVDTGIHQANTRDENRVVEQQKQQNRRAVEAIVTKADQTGVQPYLAMMARRALVGGDLAIHRFLRAGQYDALLQSLRTTRRGQEYHYVDEANGVTIAARDANGVPGSENRMTWKFVPGLAEQGSCYSMEAPARPGYYLRAIDGDDVAFAPSDGTKGFHDDATWCVEKVPGGVMLRSYAHKAAYFQEYEGRLRFGGFRAFHYEEAMGRAASTWAVDPPHPNTVSAIMLRWNNDDALKASIGNPAGDEVADGPYTRYRPFERGRVYWTYMFGAKAVHQPLLDAYLRVGAAQSSVYGPPRDDDQTSADGKGKYNVFSAGGSVYYHPDAGGAFVLYGGIKHYWDGLGGLNSFLRYPASDEHAGPGRLRRSKFQGGWIDFDPVTGTAQAYANP